ncbi:hypothetical protein BOTNAR_0031g00480 [Botryotinia narcissicola]|uniref:Uncharacterized protein n=1 Tax=Botryotinia narcissicola TaxID=278944 RepID=A0A4Z1J2Y3_9HELO|nr:hypothetical protein BOTNAR_0031g00480 [Botryotinia narcissicola]
MSLAKLPGAVYKDLPLTTRVLIAFGEVKLESYDNARDMLGPILDEVKGIYGSQSMEVFLISATLVNCLNRCRMEALAEELINSIFGKAVGQLEMPTTTQEFIFGLSTIPNHYTNRELSMIVAFTDSLIGQGKHDDALSLFHAILKKGRPDCESITMSVALRITKINRRLNIKFSTDDVQSFDHSNALEVLRDVSEFYPRVSSILKYAFVEEFICHLSLLEDIDTRQRFVASEIIKVLNLESIPYKGSESSRISFFENLQTINQYAEQLKLLMADGAPEFLASNMAQRFPTASVDLIKKIIRASWQRFNRIQEMRVMPDIDDIPDAKESLNYRDSGLGSSTKTTSNILESSNNSLVSYRSFINNDAKSITLNQIPETVKSEGQFLCFVCEKTIRGITGEAQYRTDIGVHLKEHHATRSLGNKSTEHISTLRCPFCDELPGEVGLIGHICHQLEELLCSVISQETGEDLENNSLDIASSDPEYNIQESDQIDADQEVSRPHGFHWNNEDPREPSSKDAEFSQIFSLFMKDSTDTKPITQYTETNNNNDKLTQKASTEITDSLVDSLASTTTKENKSFAFDCSLYLEITPTDARTLTARAIRQNPRASQILLNGRPIILDSTKSALPAQLAVRYFVHQQKSDVTA